MPLRRRPRGGRARGEPRPDLSRRGRLGIIYIARVRVERGARRIGPPHAGKSRRALRASILHRLVLRRSGRVARANCGPAALVRKTMSRKILPVIMCGGAGTRVWPESRETMPKQFIPLDRHVARPFRTRCGASTDRSSRRRSSSPIATTAFSSGSSSTKSARRRRSSLEPSRRDSGPAVAVAAELAAKRDPGDDRRGVRGRPRDPQARRVSATCESAAAAAADGFIVTLGVTPSEPAVGYGYIRPGAAIASGKARAVEAFVEKPDAPRAERYVAAGLSLEFRQFLLPRRRHARGIATPSSRRWPKRRRARSPAAVDDLGFLALDAAGVRRRAEEVDRLRRDGAHQARGGGARRHRLVRRRRLGRGVEAEPSATRAATPSTAKA